MDLERLNPQLFESFRELIYQKSGIRIDEKKVTLLSNRIRRRLRAGDFENFEVYYQYLTSTAGSQELTGFLDAITTNETFFFRTPKHFDWLRSELLTQQIAERRACSGPSSLRIWSAGCANGAEPYTIAICLAENSYRLRDWSLTIVGTDISQDMLRIARQGAYPTKALKGVSDQQRRRFFQHQAEGDLWQVRPEIRQMVEFSRHNLLHPISQAPFDCIFIRNVLIYFDRQSKRVAINNLLSALKIGGYLVVGPSEGIYDMLTPLRKISPLLYQKVDTEPAADKGDRHP